MLNSDKVKNIYDSIDILCNDINTPSFLTGIFTPKPLENLGMLCTLIGFKPSILYLHFQHEIDPYIIELANKREAMKSVKDWISADFIRDEITAQGYAIMDQQGGGFKLNKKK